VCRVWRIEALRRVRVLSLTCGLPRDFSPRLRGGGWFRGAACRVMRTAHAVATVKHGLLSALVCTEPAKRGTLTREVSNWACSAEP
jgi:hypothetical protein